LAKELIDEPVCSQKRCLFSMALWFLYDLHYVLREIKTTPAFMAKRVYFAFDYQDVIDFRANVVRKHNFAEV